jgi:hypothetical protein
MAEAASGGRTWWAHLKFTRINIQRTIRKKEIEESLRIEPKTSGVGKCCGYLDLRAFQEWPAIVVADHKHQEPSVQQAQEGFVVLRKCQDPNFCTLDALDDPSLFGGFRFCLPALCPVPLHPF